MINLSSFIRFHALQTPEKIAIVYGDLRITYHELNDRILATAGMMTDEGIKAGDILALVMKNSTAFLDIPFATRHIGAIFSVDERREGEKLVMPGISGRCARH